MKATICSYLAHKHGKRHKATPQRRTFRPRHFRFHGDKIDQARKAIKFCIESLHDNDRFEIIGFSTEAEPRSTDSNPQATRTVRGHSTSSKTSVQQAGPLSTKHFAPPLKLSKIRKKESQRLTLVLFLTDGRPTIGETNEDSILNTVTSRLGKTNTINLASSTLV